MWLGEKVVRDGNLVTSRGAQDLGPFVKAIKQLYSLQAPIPRDEVRPRHSAPRQHAPPALVAGAMKWIPKPSVRMALPVGALVAGAAMGERRAR